MHSQPPQPSSKRPKMNPPAAKTDTYVSRTTASYLTGTVFPLPDLSSFNLTHYLSGYDRYAKIERALFAGKVCPQVASEAYAIAIQEIKEQTANVDRYDQVVKFANAMGMDIAVDDSWVAKSKEDNDSAVSLLTAEIEKAIKKNLKRDAMERQIDLAEQYERMGRLDAAIAEWQKARNFCTNISDTARLHLRSAHVSAEMDRWSHVGSLTQNVFTTLSNVPTDLSTKISFLRLQADFAEGKWAAVAHTIANLAYDSELTTSAHGPRVITPVDVALYGTLAGLAAFSRDDIKQKLIENNSFRLYLEHMPECLKLLQSFYRSNYSAALSLLEVIASLGRIDLIISRHMAALSKTIKENIVVLYTQPFVSTSLSSMAKALCFNSTNELEKELVRLILANRIQGRIDGAAGYLVNYTVNPRDKALESIERMYKSFGTEADLMLARIQYLEEETALGGSKGSSNR